MARQRGLGARGLSRVSEELSSAGYGRKAIPEVTGISVKRNEATTNKKVHAGKYVHDAAYDIDQHDCGPWIEVTSTRVSEIRYDYQNRALQVLWANKPRERGYVYEDVPYERFRAFIRASSKGKFVNSSLTWNYDYRQMEPAELDAPSNDRRSIHGMQAGTGGL